MKAGDKVICILNYEQGKVFEGMSGTILKIKGDTYYCKWDTLTSGHNCDGLCEEGKGYNVNRRNIEKHSVDNWESEFR